jgi:ribose-phosphate pyrophosphokinase
MKHIDKALDQVDCGRTCIFYPDEGAMKRYSDRIPYPYAFGIKKRDWETGKIQGLDIQNKELVVGKDILIIDDICSKGGTFYHSAKGLKEAGAANVYLYVTHLEESVFSGDLWKAMRNENPLIKTIYTANPMFKDPDMLKIGAVVGKIEQV